MHLRKARMVDISLLKFEGLKNVESNDCHSGKTYFIENKPFGKTVIKNILNASEKTKK